MSLFQGFDKTKALCSCCYSSGPPACSELLPFLDPDLHFTALFLLRQQEEEGLAEQKALSPEIIL